jgi:hypothetical protein
VRHEPPSALDVVVCWLWWPPIWVGALTSTRAASETATRAAGPGSAASAARWDRDCAIAVAATVANDITPAAMNSHHWYGFASITLAVRSNTASKKIAQNARAPAPSPINHGGRLRIPTSDPHIRRR